MRLVKRQEELFCLSWATVVHFFPGELAEKKLKEDIERAQNEVDDLQRARSTVALSGVCWCFLFPCLCIVKNKYGTCHVNKLEERMREAEDLKEDLVQQLDMLQKYGQLPQQAQPI